LQLTIAILFLVSAVFAQNANDSISLMDAVNLAMRTDNNLAGSKQNILAADQGIKSAKGAYYPKLSLSGSYSHLSKTSEISISIPGFGENKIQTNTDNPFNTSLAANWDVYTFGRRSAMVGIAGQDRQTSQLGYDYTRKQLFDNVARSYLLNIYAQASYDLVQAEKNRFLKIYNLAESRYQQALMSEFDLLQLQLRLKRYELTTLELENDLQTARVNLVELLGLPSDSLPELSDNFDMVVLELPDYGDNTDILFNRDDYNQALSRSESARLAGKVRKSTYFPNVSLFSAYDFRNGYQPDLDDVEGNFTVGVNFSWLLFDGFSRCAELAKQNYIWKSSTYYADDLKSMIPTQVKSARLAMANSRTQIELGQKTLEVADKAMSIAQTRYDLGDISMIELLEVENSLAEAELGLLQLNYQLLLAELNLKAAAGYYPELDLLN
jgi:outer membrane protein